jgi:hypothetical protein
MQLTQNDQNRRDDHERRSPSPRPLRPEYHLLERAPLRDPRGPEAPTGDADREPGDLVRDADEVLQPIPELTRADAGGGDAEEGDGGGREEREDRHAAGGCAGEKGGGETAGKAKTLGIRLWKGRARSRRTHEMGQCVRGEAGQASRALEYQQKGHGYQRKGRTLG